MADWVGELLQCLRPLKGEAETVDLVTSIHEALSVFWPRLDQLRIQTVLDIDGPVAVISHRLLLGQVLNSVLANAIEAMPGGGTLHLTLQRNGPDVLLFIDDSGPGLTRQQQMAAFKSFYSTKQGGLGIGLVMVRQVMEHFGGHATLQNLLPKGTRASLRFRVEVQQFNRRTG
ncbi:Alginate biosynthesis sensor protein KinB [compost metagenome]